MDISSRVTVLEELMKAILYGLLLEDRAARERIAVHLYSLLEAFDRHATDPELLAAFPADVRAELSRYADSLAELDNLPDPLKPVVRPFVGPKAGP